MDKADFDNILSTGLDELKLDYHQRLLDNLWIYMNYLLVENEKYNLTAIDKEEEIISKHFLDSLVFFTVINPRENASFIDIGTGAGFPGLVLKIFRPDLDFLLVDSLKKRINFLNKIIEKLDLSGVKTIHARAEELGEKIELREGFDYAVSRAVASVNILSEYTLPFVEPGGSTILFKGPDYQKELNEGLNAIKILGGKFLIAHKVEIPSLVGKRFLIQTEKIVETPRKYPRRTGIPKKRPL